jgi:hypothetical protein
MTGSAENRDPVPESPVITEIIRRKLPITGCPRRTRRAFCRPRADVAGFIRDKHVVIIPPGYSFEIGRENKAHPAVHRERGRLVPSITASRRGRSCTWRRG